jgi:hypothetical protein
MNWISVKDRLPDGECIAIGEQDLIMIGYLEYVSRKGWICENDFEVLERITHWMPLPEPPKQ